jgi:hypothetical protein
VFIPYVILSDFKEARAGYKSPRVLEFVGKSPPSVIDGLFVYDLRMAGTSVSVNSNNEAVR